MWELILAIIVVITVAFICYVYNNRRGPVSLFLGIAAGLVTLMVTQGGNKTVPTPTEIGSRAVFFMAIAVEIALGVYISLMNPTRDQITIEKAN